MTKAPLIDAYRTDRWFAAFVIGEALLICLGLVLPLAFPFPKQGPLALLLMLTGFRFIYFWGIATRQSGFHWPYLLGATLFFLGTSNNLYELYRIIFGYFGPKMHWGIGLTLFAWAVRGIGVSWCLARGRQMESDNGFPAAFATALLIVTILCLFTPLGLFMMMFNRLIYGIFIESL